MATSTDDLSPRLGAGLRASVLAVCSLYRAAACSIAVLTPDGGQLRFVAAHGMGEDEVTGLTVSRDTGIAGWVVSSGTTLAVADVTQDPRFSTHTAERTGYLPATILAAPLVDGGDPIGVTEVLDPGARERDLEGLAAIATLLAVPIALERPGTRTVDDAVDAVLALGPEAAELAVDLLRAVAAHEDRRR